MSVDLFTSFGGLSLRTPLIVGACPLTAHEQTQIALVSAGAGAIVLPSFFGNGGSTSILGLAETPQERTTYLELVRRASENLPLPVIASISCGSLEKWLEFAGELQDAGASGIEWSVQQCSSGTLVDPRDVEDETVKTVCQLNELVSIPLFVKLPREFTSISHLARRLLSGTQGMILFGRQPDTDLNLDTMRLQTEWGLTSPGAITRILGVIMEVHAACPSMPLAACGGIASPDELIKALLVGADVALVTSAIYRDSPDVIRSMLDGLRHFMDSRNLTSISELYAMRLLGNGKTDERDAYRSALAAHPTSQETRVDLSTLQGDRWGHPK